jgi:nitroreductase
MALAAHALGLGTVNVGIFDAKKAAEILKLPEDYCVVTLMPLGYPDGEAKTPPRKELAETVSYDSFGGKP